METISRSFRLLGEYATSGETPSGFDAANLQGAFRPKRRRR